MNGKKAKSFRKAAGLTSADKATYVEVEHTVRLKAIPIYVKGKPILDSKGNIVSSGSFKTATIVLDQCARQVYKILKGLYSKGGNRG